MFTIYVPGLCYACCTGSGPSVSSGELSPKSQTKDVCLNGNPGGAVDRLVKSYVSESQGRFGSLTAAKSVGALFVRAITSPYVVSETLQLLESIATSIILYTPGLL